MRMHTMMQRRWRSLLDTVSDADDTATSLNKQQSLAAFVVVSYISLMMMLPRLLIACGRQHVCSHTASLQGLLVASLASLARLTEHWSMSICIQL
jgi:hypothetical protein